MGGSGPLDAGRHVPLPAAPIVRARGVQKADGQSLDVPAVRQDTQTAWPGALRSARGHKGAGSCRREGSGAPERQQLGPSPAALPQRCTPPFSCVGVLPAARRGKLDRGAEVDGGRNGWGF